MATMIIDGVVVETPPEVEAGLPAAVVQPVPLEVTNFQCRAVLMATAGPGGGTLFTAVDSALKAAGGLALQAWEYANTVTRSGPLVASLADQLGVSDEQLDAMFIAASTISA